MSGAPLDIEQALEMTGGDADFLKEILEEFMQHSATQISTLRAACGAGDARQVEFEAHAIKGSSVTVGAQRLSTIAENLEKAAQAGQSAELAPLVATLDTEFRSVCAFVKQYLKIEDAAIDMGRAMEMAGNDTEFLQEVLSDFVQHSTTQLQNIEKALEDSNMDSLRFEAHTIKGSAATIGAMPVSRAALALERAATGVEPGDLKALIATITREFDRVRVFQASYKG